MIKRLIIHSFKVIKSAVKAKLILLAGLICLIFIACKDETRENDDIKIYDEVREIYFDSNPNEITMKFDERKVFSFVGYSTIQGADTMHFDNRTTIPTLNYHKVGDWFEFKITEKNIFVKLNSNSNTYERYLTLKLPRLADLCVLSITQAGKTKK